MTPGISKSALWALLAGTTIGNAPLGSTWAQDANDEPTLEHVLVTGEKVERSYLETFSSVGIVTGEDLEAYDIADTSDAYQRLANVRAFADGTGTKSITIRGLNADGVTQPANAATLISVVVDGVTQSNEGLKRGSRGLWDVQQLEVHRGPQGTTQGRNALAGTVVIKSKDPLLDSSEYKFRALYGELDRREIAGAVSVPIVEDHLAFRLSGEYAEKTSDINFAYPANEPFAEDEYHNLRGKLLYKPQGLEALEILLSVSDVFDSPSSAPVTGPDFFERNFDSESEFAEMREMSAQNYSADVSYQLANGMVLRSTTAWNDTDMEIGSVPSSESYLREDHRKDGDFMQELRLELNEEIAGLTGVAGLFYGDFDQHVTSFIEINGALIVQDGTFDNGTESWAAYADLRYGLSDAVSLLFGGRYQHDTVFNRADLESAFGPNSFDRESDFGVFLPKIGVSYALDDTQTLALTASKGYRQGFAQLRHGTESELIDVDPEYLWAYELAYRVVALDQRLVLGANLFFNDYTDQQVTVVNPDFFPLTSTYNAGDSQSWGSEIEVQYFFGSGFNIYAALGLLKTELGDFPAIDCDDGSCDGNQYSEAPEVTASLGGEYRHSNGFFASVSSSYTDSFYKTINNQADLVVDSNFLVNAIVGWDFGHYRINAYANNLFDEEYLTGIVSPERATIGDGRALGVEIQANF